jgi:hypothetical protein
MDDPRPGCATKTRVIGPNITFFGGTSLAGQVLGLRVAPGAEKCALDAVRPAGLP